MRYLAIIFVAAFLAVGLVGCTHVTSGMPSTGSVSGEAWYVKSTGFFGLTFSTSIFYCPASVTNTHIVCTQAIVHELEDDGEEGGGAQDIPPPPSADEEDDELPDEPEAPDDDEFAADDDSF